MHKTVLNVFWTSGGVRKRGEYVGYDMTLERVDGAGARPLLLGNRSIACSSPFHPVRMKQYLRVQRMEWNNTTKQIFASSKMVWLTQMMR